MQIKASNKNFVAKIGSLPGSEDILLESGFEVTKEGEESFYVMPEAKASQLSAEVCPLLLPMSLLRN